VGTNSDRSAAQRRNKTAVGPQIRRGGGGGTGAWTPAAHPKVKGPRYQERSLKQGPARGGTAQTELTITRHVWRPRGGRTHFGKDSWGENPAGQSRNCQRKVCIKEGWRPGASLYHVWRAELAKKTKLECLTVAGERGRRAGGVAQNQRMKRKSSKELLPEEKIDGSDKVPGLTKKKRKAGSPPTSTASGRTHPDSRKKLPAALHNLEEKYSKVDDERVTLGEEKRAAGEKGRKRHQIEATTAFKRALQGRRLTSSKFGMQSCAASCTRGTRAERCGGLPRERTSRGKSPVQTKIQ